MKEGDQFDSLDEFLKQLKEYEKTVFSNYYIRDSRSLTSHLKRFPNGIANPKLELKYYYVRVSCIKGGREFVPRNKVRKTHTYRQGCPAGIYLKISSCGQYLVIKSLNENHSHSLSQSLFDAAPKQRLNIDSSLHEECKLALSSGANKKMIQGKIFQETGNLVTLKDLNNMIRKPRGSKCYTDCSNMKKPPEQKTITDVNNMVRIPTMPKSVADCINLLNEVYKCEVHISTDKENNLKGLFFQDEEMRKMFDAYPEVMFVDRTYNLHESKAATYLIAIEDSNGKGVIVAVGILLNELEETLDWFFMKFKETNPHCVELKVIISDKESKERSVFRRLFPNASLQICLFHTLQTFNLEINQKKLGISNEECERAKKFMTQLAHAPTADSYNDIYARMMACVPDVIRSYYYENWHNIKEEWVMYATGSNRSFTNRTNNKVKNLNKLLKSVIKKDSTLEDFIKHFFVSLYSYRTNTIVLTSRELNKVPVTKQVQDSPEQEYENLLTPYAFKKVKPHLEKVVVYNFEMLDDRNYICPTEEGLLTVSVLTCECSFFTSMGLPCNHIFSLRQCLNLPLFDENLCLVRWTKCYILEKHPLLNRESLTQGPINSDYSDLDHFLSSPEKSSFSFSNEEKLKRMTEVCQDLCKLGSEVPTAQFAKRMKILKYIQKVWSKNEDDKLDQIKFI